MLSIVTLQSPPLCITITARLTRINHGIVAWRFTRICSPVSVANANVSVANPVNGRPRQHEAVAANPIFAQGSTNSVATFAAQRVGVCRLTELQPPGTIENGREAFPCGAESHGRLSH